MRARRNPSVGRFVMERFLLLPAGAALGLIWANVAAESYFTVAHEAAFAVNEIGMALFLGFITQQMYEAVMPGGTLHTWQRWGTAVAGAVGGTAAAVATYLIYVQLAGEMVLAQAWPVVCTVDAAAAYYVVRALGLRRGALAFVLVLALASDALAFAAFAARTPIDSAQFAALGLVGLAVGAAALLRRVGVRTIWPYLATAGPLSWGGLYFAGFHPALALIPLVPLLPHQPRADVFDAADREAEPVRHGEHQWDAAVQVAVFFFGLVNAGVVLRGYDTGTWAILAASCVGRPAGVLLGVGLGRLAGLRLPRGLTAADVVIVALATSSGFTLALFFASDLLPVGAVLQQIKLGALTSVVAAALAVAAAMTVRAGRFGVRVGAGHVGTTSGGMRPA